MSKISLSFLLMATILGHMRLFNAVNSQRGYVSPVDSKAISPDDSTAVVIPVLTDSLLQQWRIALANFGDTLVAHPDLQSVPTLAPFVRVLTLPGFLSTDNRVISGQMIWNRVILGQIDTVMATRQPGVPGFRVRTFIQSITDSPALAGALVGAHLSAEQFVSTTSAIIQAECAREALIPLPKNWTTPQSWKQRFPQTLIKNIEFIFPPDANLRARRFQIEIDNGGFESVRQAIEQNKNVEEVGIYKEANEMINQLNH